MKNKWLHFSVDKETLFALACGLLMILLSVAMNWFKSEIANVILRDALMIVLLGFFTPLYYIVVVKKQSPAVLGLHKKRLAATLAINVGAGGALLAIFVGKNTEAIVFTQGSFYAMTYIFAAGIFEMVFIYGFLRYELERAFGIVPAIFLTAAFYSLHHAGFQPEFAKLFFVGVMYVAAFYFTRSIFALFPCFWGVGACWDVLVNSDAGAQLRNRTSFVIALTMFAAMTGIGIFVWRKSIRL
ncbi:MAG: hypothetical protein K2I95_06575 [Treponemataceae bacterium]|nr:hypothetical protein [Treponemataceae bacterium]